MLAEMSPEIAGPPAARRAPATTGLDWRVEVATNAADLQSHQLAWDRLAQDALEPNVFCEPWYFLANIRHFAADRSMCVAFVYRRDRRPTAPPQLCGVFPFERRRWFKGLPVRSLRLWQHPYLCLNTPLVHRQWARQTLGTLLDWAAGAEHCAFLDCPGVHAEGPFHQALVDVLRERRLLSFVRDLHTRALIRRAANAEAYCAAAMNPLSRKEWRRQRKRLSEQGLLETRVLQDGEDVERWSAQFLELEARGWKGNEATALDRVDAAGEFFRAVVRCAHERGQLHMLGLFFNDQPIALKCNFLTGDGGFAFKIAFDERYAKSSPGVQLELDNIDELHRRPGLQWMDSCAVPEHPMINRLWKERRTIQHLLIATSRLRGNGVVGLLPLARALKRMVWR